MAQATTTTDNPQNGTSADKMSPTGTPGTGPNTTTANSSTLAPANTTQTATQPVPKDGPSFIQVQSGDMLSSNVVGLDIYNSQNDDIGKVQDFAFDASKRVTGYLSVGGFLGMGTRYVAINPDALGVLRRPEQGQEGDHERHEGPAEGGSGIQVRRPVDGEQKLSGELGWERTSLRSARHSNIRRKSDHG
jgi:hypothetical protein